MLIRMAGLIDNMHYEKQCCYVSHVLWEIINVRTRALPHAFVRFELSSLGPGSKILFCSMARHHFKREALILMARLIHRDAIKHLWQSKTPAHSFILLQYPQDYEGRKDKVAAAEAADELVWQSVTTSVKLTRG